jgi:hypothetical protein
MPLARTLRDAIGHAKRRAVRYARAEQQRNARADRDALAVVYADPYTQRLLNPYLDPESSAERRAEWDALADSYFGNPSSHRHRWCGCCHDQ